MGKIILNNLNVTIVTFKTLNTSSGQNMCEENVMEKTLNIEQESLDYTYIYFSLFNFD